MSSVSAYSDLIWPEPTANRPYILMNMVSTIDGKILTGERDEPVMDLGTKNDHATLRFIESNVDAVMIGAGSLRATPKIWYPKGLKRFVVTASGKISTQNRFFSDDPDLAWIVTNEFSTIEDRTAQTLKSPGKELDWEWILNELRVNLGVKSLLIEGGSILNSALFHAGVIDEIFLTIAPKIRLGEDVPTMADGLSFSRDQIQNFALVSHNSIGDELFLRYRKRNT